MRDGDIYLRIIDTNGRYRKRTNPKSVSRENICKTHNHNNHNHNPVTSKPQHNTPQDTVHSPIPLSTVSSTTITSSSLIVLLSVCFFFGFLVFSEFSNVVGESLLFVFVFVPFQHTPTYMCSASCSNAISKLPKSLKGTCENPGM